MDLIVSPGGPLRGEIALPGDKSLSHRAALFGALARGRSRIDNFLVAGVTDVLLQSLSRLGVAWTLDGTTLEVGGEGMSRPVPPGTVLDCGNSATAMRLLAGALAGAGIGATLDGSEGLRRRPMTRVVGPLREMGAAIEASAAGTAPLVLHPRQPELSLRPLDYRMPVASAQVKSAILLAALAGEGPTTIREPGPTRDHTERLLGSMGARVERHPSENRVTLHPPRGPLEPLTLEIPGDFSSAAFLVVAATITPGSEVTLRGVGLNPTRTGLLDALAAMGADVRFGGREERQGEPAGDVFVRASKLRGTAIAGELVVRMIDEFPALAVAAAFADGATSIRQAEELRHKETDRIAVMCRELAGVGVEVREHPDGLTIEGGRQVPGGDAASHGDHRVAMAMALAGLAAGGPVRVRNAGIVAESFPGFARALRSLGARVDERDAD